MRVSGLDGKHGVDKNRVVLNVYDLHENNDYFYNVGFGFYHTGVFCGVHSW